MLRVKQQKTTEQSWIDISNDEKVKIIDFNFWKIVIFYPRKFNSALRSVVGKLSHNLILDHFRFRVLSHTAPQIKSCISALHR